MAEGDPASRGELAIVLDGGGARAAHQVGFLRSLVRNRPDLDLPIITGVSAGAINAAFLAARQGSSSSPALHLGTRRMLAVSTRYRLSHSRDRDRRGRPRGKAHDVRALLDVSRRNTRVPHTSRQVEAGVPARLWGTTS